MLFTLLVMQSEAQFISFSEAEMARLKKRVKADEHASRLYQTWKAVADKALDAEPGPIARITSQGLLMGNPAKTASLNAVADAPKMYALALAYRLDRKPEYLSKAAQFLNAWAQTNKATGNPIDETKLEEVFLAFDLLKEKLPRDTRDRVVTWFENIAAAELDSESAKAGRSTAKNNWNSHRIKIMVQTTLATGTRKFVAAIDKEIQNQIAVNLRADGSTFDFHERDALHYHIYSLEPLLKALIAWKRAGNKNYFLYETSGGASVKKSVDFLLPFASGTQKHIEFANSTVGFDKARAGNGEKGYQPAAFVPARSVPVLAEAVYFDPAYSRAIAAIPGIGSQFLNWELLSAEIKSSRR
ncbi:alginate lyase family protein [Pedobacter sp. SYP-B3415]|uniref:alginate lyase family protein n=1 Tax=Pedobacter sp. SYP-B3415 TaxID=2496641 RepID=UPI0013EAE744|nr:alginate lyase family protein [Pedobacter sp. SYP-B3415]